MNAAALFRDAALRHPDRIAFFHRDARITYRQLWERVSRFSGGLTQRGFARDDRAIVMLGMSIELYVALLAVLKCGGVAVFLDPWVGVPSTRAKAYLGSLKSQLLRLRHRNLRGIDIAPLFFGALERSAPSDEIVDADDDDCALITFTTGSSGNAKGVKRTHGILRAQHEQLAKEFPPDVSDIDLCTFPVYALNNLALGVPTLIPDVDLRRVADADASKVARDIERCGVTTASASPPLFDRLAALPSRPKLRRILTGGAPVTDAQLRAWIDAWPEAEIGVAYGSTEAEPVAHIGARERLAARSSVRPLAPGYLAGRPVAGIRARLHSPGYDGIGELIVAGPHVGRDYEGDPEAVRQNKIFDDDGTVWHRMGDTGYFDELGRFWIAGRVHSTISREGVLVHPQLVEQAALGDDHFQVAALGVDGRVVVVIFDSRERRHGRRTPDEIRERVERAGLPCDRVVFMTKALPVDPRHNSKIDYTRLKERLT
jgi:acyl-CoA synthetase (AMP-forming)/AMP-acid ligase II